MLNVIKDIAMFIDGIVNIFRPKRKILTPAGRRDAWIAKDEWSSEDEYYYQEKLKQEKAEAEYDQGELTTALECALADEEDEEIGDDLKLNGSDIQAGEASTSRSIRASKEQDNDVGVA